MTESPRLPATVVVTRPQREAGAWVGGLQAHGLSALALPLMAFGPPADARTLTQAWQTWRECGALMFVSPQAVHAFFEAGVRQDLYNNTPFTPSNTELFAIESDFLIQPRQGEATVSAQTAGTVRVSADRSAGLSANLSAGGVAESGGLGAVRCWAPGPGTARALRQWGVPSGCIDQPPSDSAQFDSEALWPAVRDQMRPGVRLLIVRGEVGEPAQPTQSAPTETVLDSKLGTGTGGVSGQGAGQGSGRDWLARQCEAAGAEVRWCVAYRRQAPQWTALQLAQAHRAVTDGSVWLISSSESLVYVRHLLPSADWRGSTALVTHPRIAQAAQALGFGRVWQSRPALADVAHALWSHQP